MINSLWLIPAFMAGWLVCYLQVGGFKENDK